MLINFFFKTSELKLGDICSFKSEKKKLKLFKLSNQIHLLSESNTVVSKINSVVQLLNLRKFF